MNHALMNQYYSLLSSRNIFLNNKRTLSKRAGGGRYKKPAVLDAMHLLHMLKAFEYNALYIILYTYD